MNLRVKILFAVLLTLAVGSSAVFFLLHRNANTDAGLAIGNELVNAHTPETSLQLTSSMAFLAPQLVTTSTLLNATSSRLIKEPTIKPGEHAIRVPVLMFHYVRPIPKDMGHTGRLLSVTPEYFDAQMKALQDAGYHTITPQELHDAVSSSTALPTKPVLITFDDGYRDQYENAFPVLKKYQLKATFFLITKYFNYPNYLNIEMAKEMEASGLATIGSHTRNHAALASVTDAVRHDEIFESKHDIESALGHQVPWFCYPYGSFNDKVLKDTSDAGYQLSFTTLLGSLHAPSSLLELRRIRVLEGERLVQILDHFSEKR